ncbi:sugar ABC transporter substrate-binding protein [Auritidibacter sp. NML120779]|nr:sugar ABC transporter substrate-binding protein [Auritidibacter sp. NML120779]
MKHTRDLLAVSATAVMASLALSGCGDNGSGGGDGGSYQVGISQYVAHPSLDATREGFKEALEEAGLEVDYDEQNAAGDQSTVNSISGNFANNSDLDLIVAVATPSAIGVASAITDRPILFGAVTDPVDANLVEDWEAPGGNVTGVSDLNPVEDQFQMIRDVMPDATTIGIPYSSAESNSEVQVRLARQAAEELDFEIEESTVTNSSEVQQAVNTFSDVDAIWVPTDNVIVSTLETVIGHGEDHQIPVFAGEPDSVERGAVGTFGIDYHAQGQQLGEMAVEILENGADPAEMAVIRAEPDTMEMTVNPGAAERMGLEFPQETLDEAVTVGDDTE